MNRANYRILKAEVDVIVIEDLGPWDKHLTITNDAEQVVKDLAIGLNGRKLYYYDSDGMMDELLVKDGKFAGFKVGEKI